MMRSLYSGISGLRNHQTRMDVIGNNIANVNTAGYKTSRVIFQDIFSQNVSAGMGNQDLVGGTNPTQIGLGIRLSTVDVIHSRSAFQRTDRETDMMVNGDGFFIVAAPDGGYFYTRAGNFDIDNEGYLVNSLGYYVLGVNYNLKMGVVDLGSSGDDPPIIWDGVAPPTPPAGYRPPVLGIVAEVEEPIDESDRGYTDGLSRTRLRAFPSRTPTAPLTAAQQVAVIPLQEALDTARFNLEQARASGVAADITAAQTAFGLASAALDAWMVANDFENDPGNARSLTGFSVGNDGSISVIIDNRKVVIGELQLAMFSNPPGLEKAGNSLYRETASSGPVLVSKPIVENGAGRIDAGGLEMSNVDLASEFTDMIVTQRGFQANSRIITVSDTMLEELVNLKR